MTFQSIIILSEHGCMEDVFALSRTLLQACFRHGLNQDWSVAAPVRSRASLLVLALLAFVVGGASGLLGAVFRLVLEPSDRFRGVVIDWAHDKQIVGFALVVGIAAIAARVAID